MCRQYLPSPRALSSRGRESAVKAWKLDQPSRLLDLKNANIKSLVMNSKHTSNLNSIPVSHGVREHLLKMCSLTVLTIISFTPDLGVAQSATPAVAQSPTTADADTESSGVQKAAASTGPIVHNWHFKNDAGSANLTVNPDGEYLFSGDYRKKNPGHDLDIVLGLKSSSGGVVLFQFAGDASNGATWSKQGKSDILKDDFTAFAGPHDWYVQYQLPLSAEGRAKLYEEREKKKEKLEKEEKEAKERHDEKVAAEKKAALEKEKKQEREKAEAAAKERQEKSTSGSSGWSTVGTVLATIGGFFLSLF
jgi:hypothetical protein